MYQIKCVNRDNKEYILHDSRSNNLRVIQPKCELELNKTGSLTFKLPPNHVFFDKVKKLNSEISLYQDGKWLFTGRVLNDEVDIYNFKTVECEGILAYLLDSIQRNKPYHISGETKIKEYLTDIINIHNGQVDEHKRFSVGNITEVDKSEIFYKYSSYDDTLTTLNEDLLKTFNNTYLSVRVDNDKKYLDYVSINDLQTNNQIIQFGKNILKLNKYVKGEEIATVIVPLGESVNTTETEDGGTLDYKLDISELPESTDGTIVHPAGADYIYDTEAVKDFGKITKVIVYSEVTEAENLLKKAKEQLNYYKLLYEYIELNAFDLHLLNVDIQSINVGQKIKVVSSLHELNNFMIVEKMTINLDSPDKNTIVLSSTDRSTKKLSGISNKNSDIDKNVSSIQKDLNNSNFLNKSDLNSNLDDYMTNNLPIQLNTKIPDYFNSQIGMGGVSDLSQYATKAEVNMAFSELSTLIGGI